MPSKRRTPKAPLTRAVRQRTRVRPKTLTLNPPLVRAEEKRQLILAHAATRRPHDPVQLASLWAGTAATFVVVVLAWWWASKPAYLPALSSPTWREFQFLKPEKAAVESVMQSFSPEKVGTMMNDLASAATRLDALATQVAREQRALDRMAVLVSETSSQPTLFQATQSSTSSQP